MDVQLTAFIFLKALVSMIEMELFARALGATGWRVFVQPGTGETVGNVKVI